MAEKESSKGSRLIVKLELICPIHWNTKLVADRLIDFCLSSRMPGYFDPNCFKVSVESEQADASSTKR